MDAIPQEMRGGQELTLHIHTPNVTGACFLAFKKLNVHKKSFALKEDLTSSRGYAASEPSRETPAFISRACSVLCWLAETCGFLFPLMLRLGLVPMLTLQSYTGPGDSREKNTSGCFP